MKSVGRLTDFVRQQMLEETDVQDRIKALKQNFDNLTQSYQQVKKARDQLDLLRPLLKQADTYQQHEAEWQDLESLTQAVPVYFAEQKADLLDAAIAKLTDELTVLINRLKALDKQLSDLRQREKDLEAAISTSAEGQRLDEIARQLEILQEEKGRREQQWKKYSNLYKF